MIDRKRVLSVAPYQGVYAMSQPVRRRWRIVSLIAALVFLGAAVTMIILNPAGVDTSHAQFAPTPAVTALPPTATTRPSRP
jgi:ABC-type uncharacterized transport system permease subunit